MQCTACGTINPTQARFCMGCGRKLTPALVCRECHSLLPAHAQYCFHCGTFVGHTEEGISQHAQSGSQVQVPEHPEAVVTSSPESTAIVIIPNPYAALSRLPEPRTLEELLPLLRHYLPDTLLVPLQQSQAAPTAAARDHLTHLLHAVKTHLPLPVILKPQIPGEPAGGVHKGAFLFVSAPGLIPLSRDLQRAKKNAKRVFDLINSAFSDVIRELIEHGGTLLTVRENTLLGLFPGETAAELRESTLHAAQAGEAMIEVLKQSPYAAIKMAGKVHHFAIQCGIATGPYFYTHAGIAPHENNPYGRMAFIISGSIISQARMAGNRAGSGETVMSTAAHNLVTDLVQGEAIAGPSEENYVRITTVTPADKNDIARPQVDEPPLGEILAQTTYLVNRLSLLTPYLPADLLLQIKEQPDEVKVMPEYQEGTVVVANVKGIDELVSRMGNSDPASVTDQINDYFARMAFVIESHHGILVHMNQTTTGGQLVAIFDVLRAGEDHATCAVHIAIEMQKTVYEHFSALITDTGPLRLEQRIGINTGQLIIGDTGTPETRLEYTVLGEEINIATNLMFHAPWGSIYISHKAAEQVRSTFKLGEDFELQVECRDTPISTCEVLGILGPAKPAPSTDPVGATPIPYREPPLVDRQEEMATLQESGQSLLNKHGQIVGIIGNSGLGKSRIKREFKTWLLEQATQGDSPRILWLEGRALSFSEQSSYRMIDRLLHSALELPQGAHVDDVLKALQKKGEQWLGATADKAIPLLANLMRLELREDWSWVRDLAPQVRQKQMFWAVGEFITGLAQQSPVVLALNDLHWADEASLALIENLLEITDRAPVMFLLVFRPRRDKGCWRLRNVANSTFPHRYVEITLKALTREDSEALLVAMLNGATFEAQVQKNILDKTAGNPFYIEEIVRTMREGGNLIQDPRKKGRWVATAEKVAHVEIPATLHAAIVARLNQLGEETYRVLQTASMIGRQFHSAILKRIATEGESTLDAHLARLEKSGLIRAHATDESDYTFPDALVQEVAYNNLGVDERKTAHRKVGEALEELFAENIEQHSDLLAYHFSQSDDDTRAIHYLQIAAEKARDEHAKATAIQHYTNLLTIMERLEDRDGQADALYQMGVMAYDIGDYQQSKPWLVRAAELYQEIGDQSNVGWSVMHVGLLDLKQANYDQAVKQHARALALAEASEDTTQRGIHLTNAGRVLARLGAYSRAAQLLKKSLKIKQNNDDAIGEGFSYYYLGMVYLDQNDVEKAEIAFNAAKDLWSSLPDNEQVLSHIHHGMGRLALARQQYEQAIEYLQQALTLSNKWALVAELIENYSYLGQACLGLERPDEALDLSIKAITLLAAQKDVEEEQRIYLNHYLVLKHREDPESLNYLKQAYDEMMKQAERIADPKDRTTFLEKVRVNQEIQAHIKEAKK